LTNLGTQAIHSSIHRVGVDKVLIQRVQRSNVNIRDLRDYRHPASRALNVGDGSSGDGSSDKIQSLRGARVANAEREDAIENCNRLTHRDILHFPFNSWNIVGVLWLVVAILVLVAVLLTVRR
jgi:hypothetical protein